jgi:hypothetical protein
MSRHDPSNVGQSTSASRHSLAKDASPPSVSQLPGQVRTYSVRTATSGSTFVARRAGM